MDRSPLPALLLCLACCVTLSWSAAIAAPPLEASSQAPEIGLYNASDKVFIVNDVNYKNTVLNQNHSAILLEFYNSFCGHCRRFAPQYKKLAEDLYAWQDVLLVAALDCAVEENNGICREYEIMGYPTLRYFSPNYEPSPQSYGQQIDTLDLTVIRSQVAQWLADENSTTTKHWPNFHAVAVTERDRLFDGADDRVKLLVLVYEPENTTISYETILHFNRWNNVRIRRIADAAVALAYQIDGTAFRLATVDRSGHIRAHVLADYSVKGLVDTIEALLTAQHLTERTPNVRYSTPRSALKLHESFAANHSIIAEVLHGRHRVYQADLEMAVRQICFNEIPKSAHIAGDSLLALERFLGVLQRYNPLGPNGQSFVAQLHGYVVQFNQSLSGKEFEQELTRLERELPSIFAANQYIGCSASQSGLRGYTCSLWTLFHYMTVQAAQTELSNDPLEVLQAIHGYVKHFFGCTNCAEHFQEMAKRRRIWNTPNKEEAVLWLWSAHNEVNKRLAGDETEDPKFPKQQFPTNVSCAHCVRSGGQFGKPDFEIDWDTKEVLSFMTSIYDPNNISQYGMTHVELLRSPVAEKLRQKRLTGNVFSDMDMQMGLLLYGFCILMMVVAFKLFVFKGYRKKPYGHDALGKV